MGLSLSPPHVPYQDDRMTEWGHYWNLMLRWQAPIKPQPLIPAILYIDCIIYSVYGLYMICLINLSVLTIINTQNDRQKTVPCKSGNFLEI